MKLKTRATLFGAGAVIALMFFSPPSLFSGIHWTDADNEKEPVTLRAMWSSGQYVDITWRVNGVTYSDSSRSSPWVRHEMSRKNDAVSMHIHDPAAQVAGTGTTHCQVIRGSNIEEDIRDDGGSARCHEGRSLFGNPINPRK